VTVVFSNGLEQVTPGMIFISSGSLTWGIANDIYMQEVRKSFLPSSSRRGAEIIPMRTAGTGGVIDHG
jgi:hypothetical protein